MAWFSSCWWLHQSGSLPPWPPGKQESFDQMWPWHKPGLPGDLWDMDHIISDQANHKLPPSQVVRLFVALLEEEPLRLPQSIEVPHLELQGFPESLHWILDEQIMISWEFGHFPLIVCLSTKNGKCFTVFPWSFLFAHFLHAECHASDRNSHSKGFAPHTVGWWSMLGAHRKKADVDANQHRTKNNELLWNLKNSNMSYAHPKKNWAKLAGAKVRCRDLGIAAPPTLVGVGANRSEASSNQEDRLKSWYGSRTSPKFNDIFRFSSLQLMAFSSSTKFYQWVLFVKRTEAWTHRWPGRFGFKPIHQPNISDGKRQHIVHSCSVYNSIFWVGFPGFTASHLPVAVATWMQHLQIIYIYNINDPCERILLLFNSSICSTSVSESFPKEPSFLFVFLSYRLFHVTFPHVFDPNEDQHLNPLSFQLCEHFLPWRPPQKRGKD